MHLSWMWSAFLALALVLKANGDVLEAVDDKELARLIEQEQYVLVLFADEDDAKSTDFETELAAVREDLVDSLNAWVVKSVNKEIKEWYTKDKGPALVFFRGTVPVLYDGAADEEELLEMIALFKEPCVRDLNDNNFEHLTQASTGATTGDWFVMFIREECEECALLRAKWETLACKNKGRINVAVVDKGGSGAVTGRRFEVTQMPEFILFRLGKMYRYTIGKLDLQSFTSFITGWYKNVKAESIPLPKTPFDDLVQMCADYVRDEPLIVGVCVAIPIVLLLLFYFLTMEETKPKKKKKKNKSKDN